MEKFTVDIDKVLDDFEFNEDRASEIATTSCYNQTQDNYPVPINNYYLNNSPHYQYNKTYLQSDELYPPQPNSHPPKIKNNFPDDNNKNHQPAKKNSVSNVFNSLQEYINSDVSGGEPNNTPNNIISYVTPKEPSKLYSEEVRLLPKIENNREVEYVEPKLDNIFISNQVHNKELVEESASKVIKIYPETISNNLGNNFVEESAALKVDNVDPEPLLPKVSNLIDKVEDEIKIENLISPLIEIENLSKEPESNLETVAIVDNQDPVLDSLEEVKDKLIDSTQLEDDPPSFDVEITEETDLSTPTEEEVVATVETEVVKTNEVTEIEEAKETSDIETVDQTNIETVKVISFDNIEVDDVSENDLDQYLQDVDNEIAILEEEAKELIKEPVEEIEKAVTIEPPKEIEKEPTKETLEECTTELSENPKDVKETISKEVSEKLESLEISDESQLKIESKPKLAAICRPNSLDIVSNTSELDENEPAPPGQTPGPKVDTDFSPTTSEVSSIENQEDLCITESQNINPMPETVQGVEAAPAVQSEYVNHSPLGKRPPYWIPDVDSNLCMHCGFKFTVIRRRHHCRACGLVLCSKCCNMKAKLEYLGDIEARVCSQCYDVLNKDLANSNNTQDNISSDSANNSPAHLPNSNEGDNGANNQPNPNNPMEYCSTVPPLKQIENQRPRTPPTVMVPVGVLKRQGSNKGRSEKTVMFSDGIRPGCDLTELDNSWESRPIRRQNKRVSTPPGQTASKMRKNLPPIDETTSSYIPAKDGCLPPTINFGKPDNTYTECSNNESVVEMLRNETLVFAIQRNFNIYVKILNLDCCVNKQVWCFSTKGLSSVGQDEIVILLEVLENENQVPKDIFLHLNNIYIDASKGNVLYEMGFSIENSPNFLDSKNHAGFLYVRPTYQCLQNIILPDAPYLFGILIHRWETPWVKIFPLRLLLRLGAEYRYYPCPIISTRNRESVFVEIGHTIINLLADFRNYSYTLPSVRGLLIHMEEKKTTVLIPKNRYDQVMRALNNSSEHILAFAGNFSSEADSHLVCIQDINGGTENGYSTHAINIQNKPRKVTGASFIILNGALKTTSGLTAKSSIIEDGLMIHILPDQMVKLRDHLRNMKTFQINCGCVNSEIDEYVHILWVDNDTNFNIGVKSPIDNKSMNGIPSIRVHNGIDHIGNSKLVRWTEVFILQSGEENSKIQDGVDISKLSESISKSTCEALVKYLELLSTYNFTKVGIRVTLHSDQVSYEAGSNGAKLAPIYMNALDNALIPVLHDITSKNPNSEPIILELIFHILNS